MSKAVIVAFMTFLFSIPAFAKGNPDVRHLLHAKRHHAQHGSAKVASASHGEAVHSAKGKRGPQKTRKI